ncbi:MAG: lumazine-binding protein [Capnocytophaga granulosa]
MKYYLYVAIGIVFSLISCTSEQQNTPEAVVKGFITAVNKNNFAEAKRYGDSTVIARMTQIEEMLGVYKGEIPQNPKIDFKVIEVTLTDPQSAIVTYSISATETYKQLKVRQIAGQWKVTLDLQEASPMSEKP